MRYYRLVTIDRRGGYCFQLKANAGRTVIGTMIINPAKARHELWLSEPDYLKHARDIAMLCRVPGCAVYVAAVVERAEEEMRKAEGGMGNGGDVRAAHAFCPSCGAPTMNHGADCSKCDWRETRPAPPALTVNWGAGEARVLPKDTRFHRLTMIARNEGINIEDCKSNRERIERINTVTLERQNGPMPAVAA